MSATQRYEQAKREAERLRKFAKQCGEEGVVTACIKVDNPSVATKCGPRERERWDHEIVVAIQNEATASLALLAEKAAERAEQKAIDAARAAESEAREILDVIAKGKGAA